MPLSAPSAPSAASDLSLTGRRWRWPQLRQGAQSGETEQNGQNESYGQGRPSAAKAPLLPWLAALLRQRGVVGPKAVAAYLKPTLSALDNPESLGDVHKAVDRILVARAQKERVVIYGDYDVDGVCSTTIMAHFLRRTGLTVDYYIPDRRAEGYGLNAAAVVDLAKRYQLLITVDCGITAAAEIGEAQNAGLDVIVVDHHQVPEQLPPAVACLDPHRTDCRYPFKDLCAAGVAFMLCIALRQKLRAQNLYTPQMPEPDMRAYLDLVATATVADMVPLHGANRILVAVGLARMRQLPAYGMRLGLKALCCVAGVDVSRMSATDVGFKIGPRINARGRMSQAALAVDLMLNEDAALAQQMANQLDAANVQRREVEAAMVAQALTQVQERQLEGDAALVVHHPHWHPGVLGLAASRLAQKYHRPAIVIGAMGQGSCRSVGGVDVHAALSACQAHLVRFGGHPMAAGLRIVAENIPAFRAAMLAAIAASMGPPPYAPLLEPELEVDCDRLDMAFLRTLEQLAPFGQGNPQPLLATRDIAVREARIIGQTQTHLKLRLGAPGRQSPSLDAIAFGLAPLLETLPAGCRLDALFHLERNIWQGRESLQMRIVDLRLSAGNAASGAAANASGDPFDLPAAC